MKKEQTTIIDANAIILHTKNALIAHSGTQLSNIKDNSLIVPRLSNNLVTATLVLEDKDVNLCLKSDLFKSYTFNVGKVRSKDVLISEQLSMIAGLKIYRLCNWLAAHGETEPMKLFNCTPDYDRVIEEKPTPKRPTEIIKNTLF